MTTHLVTGGSGYFGSILVHLLHQSGLKVKVFDLNDLEDRPKDIEFIQGDIRDRELINSLCKNTNVIYHAVAQVPLAKDKNLFWSVNVEGATNLFESALKNNVEKVIYISSSAVFGIPRKNPVDDSVLPSPMEFYGKAKYKAEQIAKTFVEKGADITIIRPRTILGHGRLGIFSILFNWVKNNINIPVLGNGNNKYQFIHASDLANACLLAANCRGSSTYNIGTDRFGTMRELLEALIKHAGSTSRVISTPFILTTTLMKITSALRLSPLGDYHSLMYGREMYFDITKPVKELNWIPKYSNSEMICESYDWFCSNYKKIYGKTENISIHKKPIEEGILSILKWF